MSTAKFNTWQNPDGTENYKCRAWVNFNGTGTVAIRAAANVTSITDNGTGDYTVNFTTAMPDANYSAVTGAGSGNTNSSFAASTFWASVPTTSSFRFRLTDSTTSVDAVYVTAAIFR
jgi:hypothetical protein